MPVYSLPRVMIIFFQKLIIASYSRDMQIFIRPKNSDNLSPSKKPTDLDLHCLVFSM